MTLGNLFYSQIFMVSRDRVNLMSMVAGDRGEVGQAFRKNADVIAVHGPSSDPADPADSDQAAKTAARYNYALMSASASSRIFVHRKLERTKGVSCDAVEVDPEVDACAVKMTSAASKGKPVTVMSVGRGVEELPDAAADGRTMVFGIGGEERTYPKFSGLRYGDMKETAKRGAGKPGAWSNWLKPSVLTEATRVVLPWDGRRVLSDQAILAISLKI